MHDSLGYFDPQSEANTWGLPHITEPDELANYSAWLYQKDGRLYLDQNQAPDLPALSLDFTAGRTAHRLKQLKHAKLPLAKACGLTKGRRPDIVDATSGLAQDGLLLAAMGSQVILLEQHPLVFVLVADALKRGREHGADWLQTILANIEHQQGNATDYLKTHQSQVVYLDPMYPDRDKASTAQVKKGMQILRGLADCYTDTTALFDAAITSATERVVVKRPVWAKSINNSRPDQVVSMPNHNFDIYLK